MHNIDKKKIKLSKDEINIRLYDTFGCTVVSTVLVQSLWNKFPKNIINVYTKNPDLILGLKEIDKIIDAGKYELDKYDIDLTDYLKIRKPQKNKPFRHLSDHMFEVAEEQLGGKLKGRLRMGFSPKINLTKKELEKAKQIVRNISKGRPVIWLQTKSRQRKKEWKQQNWRALLSEKRNEYAFIDLSSENYSKRISVAITKFCFAGITLDTFLLHGSETVGARNTIVILVSSHPEVVTYKDQIILDGSKNPKFITVKAVIDELDKLIGLKKITR